MSENWKSVSPGDLIEMSGRYVFSTMREHDEWVNEDVLMNSEHIKGLVFVSARFNKRDLSNPFRAALFYIIHPTIVGWIRIGQEADEHTIQTHDESYNP